MSDIASRVKAIIVDKLGVDENEVVTEASFTNDLGAVSYTHLDVYKRQLQKNVFPPFTISIPEISMFLAVNKSKYSCGKSSPTTETIPDFTLKCEAESPINVAAPPRILSVFPKGVSIASKATVPTIKSLFIFTFSN